MSGLTAIPVSYFRFFVFFSNVCYSTEPTVFLIGHALSRDGVHFFGWWNYTYASHHFCKGIEFPICRTFRLGTDSFIRICRIHSECFKKQVTLSIRRLCEFALLVFRFVEKATFGTKGNTFICSQLPVYLKRDYWFIQLKNIKQTSRTRTLNHIKHVHAVEASFEHEPKLLIFLIYILQRPYASCSQRHWVEITH